jgi:hypothetical protein
MYRSRRTAKSVFASPSFGTHLVFDDVIQVKYTDEITLVVGNEACDLDSGTIRSEGHDSRYPFQVPFQFSALPNRTDKLLAILLIKKLLFSQFMYRYPFLGLHMEVLLLLALFL